jgi:hypothetical protein
MDDHYCTGHELCEECRLCLDCCTCAPKRAGTYDTGEWPLPPGRRRPLSYAEEQADIINATGT